MYGSNIPSLHEIDIDNSNKYVFGQKINSVVLIGPPGSGKGTHAKMLADTGKFYHLSTGEMLREKSKKDKDLADLLASGKYLNDAQTIEVFHSYIKDKVADGLYHPKKQFLLLDGIPRTLEQNKILQDNFDFKAVVHIWVPYYEAVDRMLARKDGRPENNTEAKAWDRIKTYKSKTEPVLYTHLKNNSNNVIQISNNQSLRRAHKELTKSLEKKLMIEIAQKNPNPSIIEKLQSIMDLI